MGYMQKFMSLGLLVCGLAITLACAKGDEFLTEEHNKHFSVSTGKPFPPDIRESFKAIPGGSFTEGQPVNTSLFDNQFILATTPKGVAVNAFEMMDSEVTIDMFVRYLNAEKVSDLNGGSNSFFSDSSTGTASNDQSGNQDIDAAFKPIMQDEDYAGIYVFQGSGGRQIIPIEDFSGIQEDVLPFDFFFIPIFLFKTSNEYVDPYRSLQKSISRFQSTNSPVSDTSENTSTAGGAFNQSPEQEDTSYHYVVAPTRDTYPIVFITQEEAKEFAKWLGPNYRLPTKEEWLWASKGGKDEDFPTGPNVTETRDINGVATTFHLANYQGEFSQANPSFPVKSYDPNAWGLHDMAGNVYEWTMFKGEDQGLSTDIPTKKFVMGGSYKTRNIAILSTWFYSDATSSEPNVWAADLGFRVIYDSSRVISIADLEDN